MRSTHRAAALVIAVGCTICSASAAQQTPLAPGKGRIYFYPGPHMLNSFEIFLNGIDVGKVSHGEFLVIDVPSGLYIAERKIKSIWGTYGPPAAVTLDLKNQQTLYVAATRYSGPLYGGGALGYLLSSTLSQDPNHPVGDYLEPENGSEGIDGKTPVAADSQGVAQLNAPSSTK